jgi:hypothetical protein
MSADYVLPGDGPRAVAAYVRALANRQRVPSPLRTRRHLRLGHTADGQPFELAVRGRNVLVAGDPKSGKVGHGLPRGFSWRCLVSSIRRAIMCRSKRFLA